MMREKHIIELEPGIYYMCESASVTGFIETHEPLRASWVDVRFAEEITLPRVKKTHPKARVITIKVTYELNHFNPQP
jgi:hypothetical protein